MREGLDPELEPLVDARDETQRAIALERLLTEIADPVIRRSLFHRLGTREPELEDIRGGVMLRLVRKLDELQRGTIEPIGSFADYVAIVTFHAADDFLRRKQPQRALLSNRIRYLLTHDSRFALWNIERELICGLAKHRGERTSRPLIRAEETSAPLGDALEQLFKRNKGPLPFQDVVMLFAANTSSEVNLPIEDVDLHELAPSAFEQVASKEAAANLWREIEQLPPRQRAALLLNLREAGGGSAIPLITVTGLATSARIAELTGIPAEELASIWNQLPLDDNTIASRLGATRQQVINLRKCARERLARRLSKR
jgi:DNA-directed RNA polymerase specialized sigma24 family protein